MWKYIGNNMKTIYIILYSIAMAATIYYNGMNDPRAKYISMALFAILFVFALVKRGNTIARPKFFNKWLLWYLLACTANVLLAFDEMKAIESLLNLEIAIPLMVAFSSFYLFSVKRDKLSRVMFPICFFAAYCAIMSVISGLGGFRVSEFYDDAIAKNQIGAAFTSFAIICAVFMLEEKNSLFKAAYVVLSIANLYPALFFGCRTALLSYMVVVLFLLFRDYGWKGVIVLPLLIIIVVAVGGGDISTLLYDSIVGRRDINDLDDLSAGRITHATLSFEYFLRHPLLGFFGSGDGFNQMPPNAHIYLLFRLTKWGIIGAIPFIVLYISIFKVFLSSIRKNDLLIAGLFLLAFIESFAEYAPPFGPGSCFVVSFILLGYYLRQNTYDDKTHIIKELK